MRSIGTHQPHQPKPVEDETAVPSRTPPQSTLSPSGEYPWL